LNKLKLSERLMLAASNVKSGGIVADIGCDHAFTSIYLVENGIAKGAIALDINKEPLKRAKEHISAYGMDRYIAARLSDGAKQLEEGEADTILISGMGGALITRILGESISIIKSAEELVLSPQSETGLVRHFLHDNGFMIVNEDMVKEKGKFYVIIRAVHGTQHFEDETGYIYGEYLVKHRNQVLREYLLKEQKRIYGVLKNFPEDTSLVKEVTGTRKYMLKEEYNIIKSLIKETSRI